MQDHLAWHLSIQAGFRISGQNTAFAYSRRARGNRKSSNVRIARHPTGNLNSPTPGGERYRGFAYYLGSPSTRTRPNTYETTSQESSFSPQISRNSQYAKVLKGLNCLPMLHGWDNFFIMAGTAAATLVGLLFVAVTVSAGLSTSRIVHGTRGFLTPTLVHLGSVLFQTLVVLAPWRSAWPIGIILGLGGLMGLAYQINVVVTRHKVGLVLPHWQDWLPYVGVPALGSASLIVGAVGLIAEKSFAPYAIAAAMVLSLAAGIYGAWDLTLWMIKNRDGT